jgi:hypothetical protein
VIAKGIVLRQPVAGVDDKAAALSIGVAVSDAWECPWPQTLFVDAETEIPWDLLRHGFGLLQAWHAAAPLSGKTAVSVGTPEDRERTRAVVRDLRMPTYAHGLLFVRRGEGERLVKAWRAECDGGDESLAFLRALFLTKPVFCALPNIWLCAARRQSTAALNSIRPARGRPAPPPLVANRFRPLPGRSIR